MATSLQYSDDYVEIVCHGSRAILHDRNSDRYFQVSAATILPKVSTWKEYSPKIPNWLLMSFFFSFITLLVIDYHWFFVTTTPNLKVRDAIALACFLTLNVGAHEFAHILALRMCGRYIDKFGFKFNYKVFPAFYVRMNQALLLARNERLFCHLAGLWVNLLITLIAIICIPGSIKSTIYIFLTMITMNILPILNSDGQKAVTTLLNIDRPINMRSAGTILKLIHFSSIIAAAIIIMRFCSNIITSF